MEVRNSVGFGVDNCVSSEVSSADGNTFEIMMMLIWVILMEFF